MPDLGWDSVTVPGAVDAWARLSRRFGKLPFARLFEPAIRYARDGFSPGPITAFHWRGAERRYAAFPEFARTFLPGGHAPRAGEEFRCAALASSLEDIAATSGESFYRGALAERIAAAAAAEGGAMTRADLAAHTALDVTPMSVPFQGVDLHELPPNGQGLAALVAIGVLERRGIAETAPDSALSVHLQIEAMKLGVAAASRHVADPDAMVLEPAALLAPVFLDELARRVDPEHTHPLEHALPVERGTVYLTAADAGGMMVSFIQSNYAGFGSGVVVPGTGISLQNRGRGFTLDSGHPNCVGPAKRPFHTIIPAFVTRNGGPEMSFGVMGGPMQPQGHVQMMVRIFVHGQNLQTASDAPRWFVDDEGGLTVEPGFPKAAVEGLRARGHRVAVGGAFGLFGGAQLIRRVADGYEAASDSRKDGFAVGF
jgi:gamma-glutamyltranspeptidase/glutathione hydrolase